MIDLLPVFDKRPVRESASSKGLMSFGVVDHQICLVNVSLTGLLADFQYDDKDKDFSKMLQFLQASPLVDFYLPDMGVAGEGIIVRVEVIKTGFQLGFEFRNLTYGIDELLYKRRAFRKNLTFPGHLIFNGNHYTFNTENVSVCGMVVRIMGRFDFETGVLTRFSFKQLELQGEAQVVWGDRDYNSTLLGLEFVNKKKSDVVNAEYLLHSQLSKV